MITPITATFPALNFPKEVDYPTQEDWAAFSAAAELNYGILSGEWSDKSEEFKTQANNLALEIQQIGENAINAITFDSIAQLKLNSNMGRVDILGYYTKGDGGGGTFYWDSTSTEADNGGTIIQATGIITGRWKRVFSGAVNAKWFGAKGDGATDDTLAMQSAIDILKPIYIPKGDYKVSTLLIPSVAANGYGFSMFGDMKSTSRITVSGGINCTSTNSLKITIRDISLYADDGFSSIYNSVMYVEQNWLSIFENCIFSGNNIANGLTLNKPWSTTFVQCSFQYSNYGLLTGIGGVDSTHMVSLNCTYQMNKMAGALVRGTQGGAWIGNSFEFNDGVGFVAMNNNINSQQCEELFFEGNYFTNNLLDVSGDRAWLADYAPLVLGSDFDVYTNTPDGACPPGQQDRIYSPTIINNRIVLHSNAKFGMIIKLRAKATIKNNRIESGTVGNIGYDLYSSSYMENDVSNYQLNISGALKYIKIGGNYPRNFFNILYISNTGVSSNDGLTTSTPINMSLSEAIDSINEDGIIYVLGTINTPSFAVSIVKNLIISGVSGYNSILSDNNFQNALIVTNNKTLIIRDNIEININYSTGGFLPTFYLNGGNITIENATFSSSTTTNSQVLIGYSATYPKKGIIKLANMTQGTNYYYVQFSALAGLYHLINNVVADFHFVAATPVVLVY